MTTKVAFSWQQTLDSYSPALSITVVFSGVASIKDINANEVDIISCSAKWDGALAPESVFVGRGVVGSAQNHFLGKCREAARNAYYKERMKEAATQHNAGFIPMASDISYMEESDRFPDVTIDRS